MPYGAYGQQAYGSPLSPLAGQAADFAAQVQNMGLAAGQEQRAGAQEQRAQWEFAQKQRAAQELERIKADWMASKGDLKAFMATPGGMALGPEKSMEVAKYLQEQDAAQKQREAQGRLPASLALTGGGGPTKENAARMAMASDLIGATGPAAAIPFLMEKPKEFTPSVHTQAGVPGAWVTGPDGQTTFQQLPPGVGVNKKKIAAIPGENGVFVYYDDGTSEMEAFPEGFKPKTSKTSSPANWSMEARTFLMGQGYDLDTEEGETTAKAYFSSDKGKKEFLAWVDRMALMRYTPPPPSYVPIGVDAGGVPIAFNPKNPEQVVQVGGGAVKGPQPFIPRPTAAPTADVTNITTLNNLAGRLRNLAKTVSENPSWVGPIQGRAAAVGSKFINLPAYKRFKQEWETLREAVYGFSGKQINPQEQTWLKEVFPNITDPDQNFLSSALTAADWLAQKAQQNTASLQASGRVINPSNTPAAAAPKAGGASTLPPAGDHPGRTIRDTDTGKRYRSDGKTWKAVP